MKALKDEFPGEEFDRSYSPRIQERLYQAIDKHRS